MTYRFDGDNDLLYNTKPAKNLFLPTGKKVRCISAKYLVKFHSGYELDEDDRKDIASLCQRFGIDFPKEIADLK